MSNKGIISYCGHELKKYVSDALSGFEYERDFVLKSYSYLVKAKNDKRVLGICGLKGVGKTVGILQIIKKINDYDKCVYITLNPDTDMSYEDLIYYIDKYYSYAEYIFIDEITFVKGFVQGCATLYDVYSANGKRIVISGNDSYVLLCAEGSGLYHRIFIKNITFISYSELKRTGGIDTFDDYVKYGGLYRNDRLDNSYKLKTYVNTSVIDNIMHTIVKNKEISFSDGIKDIDSDNLRLIVYQIIFAISYSLVFKEKSFNASFVINLFKPNNSYSKSELSKLLKDELGIDDSIKVSKYEVQEVLNILEEINLVIKFENLYDGAYKYYITNPSIFNTLLYMMISILAKARLQKEKDKSMIRIPDILFEAAVINHAYVKAREMGYEVGFYHDDNDRKIDLVISNEMVYDEDDNLVNEHLFYEIKLTKVVSDVIIMAQDLKSVNLCQDDVVADRSIIYGGAEENLISDIHIIPAMRFIENTERFINILT